MNSVLQILAQIQPFKSHFVLRAPSLPAPLERDAAKSLRAVFSRMHARQGVVSPSEVFSAVKARFSSFRGNGQQDSEELYRRLMDSIHEDARIVLNKARSMLEDETSKLDEEQKKRLEQHLREVHERNGRDIAMHSLGLITITRVTCGHCGYVSQTEEMALDLQLQIPQRCHGGSLLPSAQKISMNTPKKTGAKKKAKRMAKRERKLAARNRNAVMNNSADLSDEDEDQDDADGEIQEEAIQNEPELKKAATESETVDTAGNSSDSNSVKHHVEDGAEASLSDLDSTTKNPVDDGAQGSIPQEILGPAPEIAPESSGHSTAIDVTSMEKSVVKEGVSSKVVEQELISSEPSAQAEETISDEKSSLLPRDTTADDTEKNNVDSKSDSTEPKISLISIRAKELLKDLKRESNATTSTLDARINTPLRAEEAIEENSYPKTAQSCSVRECLGLTTAPELLQDYTCYSCTRQALAHDAECLEELKLQYPNEEKHFLRHGAPLQKEFSDDPSSSSAVRPSPSIALLRGSAVRQTLLSRTAPVIALHLKRFAYGLQKLNTELYYPRTLTFGTYRLAGDPEPNHIYRFLGASCHDGSLGGGHYTAVVRIDESVHWYRISDQNAQLISERDAFLARRSAYLLFYEVSSQHDDDHDHDTAEAFGVSIQSEKEERYSQDNADEEIADSEPL